MSHALMKHAACSGIPPRPSGHSQICYSNKFIPVNPNDDTTDLSDFSGPYRNNLPPGDRNIAIGQKEWGDVPYLPAYVDPVYPIPSHPTGPVDNLFTRGQFYEGVSETHYQFSNRGGIKPKKYHTFQKHYIEPGMKNDKSITYTDYSPPYPTLPADKMPCLKPPPGPTHCEYVSKPARVRRNDLSECTPRKEPELLFVEAELPRDFSTEYSDFYVCFQKEKKKNPLLDLDPQVEERYQRYLKCTHQNCHRGVPKKTEPPPNRQQKCTSRLTNGVYPNGYLILPHKSTSQ